LGPGIADFCAEIIDRPMDELLADIGAIKGRSPYAAKYRALEAAAASDCSTTRRVAGHV
jgi:hypothetical protein